MRAKILSVLIPVKNQEELLVKAINSLPVRDDIEIIVVDDASTDDTVKNVLAIDRKDITLICVDRWMPTGYCRNLCLKAAQGEYIFWLDSDDIVDTEGFNKFIDFVYKNTKYDVINIRLLDNKGKVYDGRKKWSTCTKVSKLDFVNKYKVDFPDKVIAEDKVFWDGLKSHKPNIGFYETIFYYYNHPREGSAMWNHEHGLDK